MSKKPDRLWIPAFTYAFVTWTLLVLLSKAIGDDPPDSVFAILFYFANLILLKVDYLIEKKEPPHA